MKSGCSQQTVAQDEFRWQCPLCRAELESDAGESLECKSCNTLYPLVEGIPDLRIHEGKPAWRQEEVEAARSYASEARQASLTTLAEQLSNRPEKIKGALDIRVKQILGAHARFLRQFDGWLSPLRAGKGLILDVGCGSGGFLAAAASLRIDAIGIDASMTNLITAKHMIEAQGGVAKLACAYAESLPVAGECLYAVTMNDAIEHVSCVESAIAEAHRTLKPGGYLAMSTPNRFSLTREPHVLIWGVGWLPRPLQAPYVNWRIGKPYDHTRLMSTREMARILDRQPGLDYWFLVPPVPSEEIASFSRPRAALARLYNRIYYRKLVRPLMLSIGPFYQVFARKN